MVGFTASPVWFPEKVAQETLDLYYISGYDKLALR
jgi:hypothetical protein